MGIVITGVDRCVKALKEWQIELGEQYARGIRDIAENILEQARQICPVDTGALLASAVLRENKGKGFRYVPLIGFGTDVSSQGFERDPRKYAVFQHDAPFHRYYLEEAVHRSAHVLVDSLMYYLEQAYD